MKKVVLVIAIAVFGFGVWYLNKESGEGNEVGVNPIVDRQFGGDDIRLPDDTERSQDQRKDPDTAAKNTGLVKELNSSDLTNEINDNNQSELASQTIAEPVIDTADNTANIVQITYPDDRVIAFYGNFYSSRMGILGEYSKDQVLNRLTDVVDQWQSIDPNTRHIPAVHYIASTAQPDPTANGLYTLRMPPGQILTAIQMGKEVGGVTFLDLQIGQATLLDEVRILEPYLHLPDVHLGIDPEFAMSDDEIPGELIGTIDADEINVVIDYLVRIVRANNLPPKTIVIHRFTENMLTNVSKINSVPEVNVVINMDGWGSPELKFSTYQNVISNYPIALSGYKIFYKNDLRTPSTRLTTIAEVLGLDPVPVYIQYQ